jgi:hypothetical protein
MSQSGGPSTTQPPSAPTGGLTSKTWLWVIGGLGVLAVTWVLLRRE